MHIEVRQQPFSPWQELSRYENSGKLEAGSYGACATFVGSMRNFNQGEQVTEMQLEHYPGMTEKLLLDFAEPLVKEKNLIEMLVIHRVGRITPDEPIVLVAAWSAHRAAAFEGCREMMEYLKSNATFWKKETLEGSSEDNVRWVDNISG